MESITYLKNLKISPKKLRFFLPVIKKMTPVQAIENLYYSPNAPARIFYKAIQSAVANAKNTLKAPEDLLQFRVLTVEEGQKLKRYNPGGRGTPSPYVKRLSHIKIILGVNSPVEVAKKDEGKQEKVKKEIPLEKIKTKEIKKPRAKRAKTVRKVEKEEAK